jgi:SpoIID/LytB domain protein
MEFGLSQTGADALAKQGRTYVDILRHFYSNTDVLTLE